MDVVVRRSVCATVFVDADLLHSTGIATSLTVVVAVKSHLFERELLEHSAV